MKLLALLLFIVSCASSNRSDQVPKKIKFNKQALQKECDEGHQSSCSRLVDVIHATEGFTAAHQFAKAQCAQDKKDFCFYRAKVIYFNGQVEEGVSVLEKLCTEKDAFACNMLGTRIFVNNYYTKKADAPNPLYKKACNLGDRYSCLIEYINTGSDDQKKLDSYFPVSENVATRIVQFLDYYKSRRFALWENIIDRLCKEGNRDACLRQQIEIGPEHKLAPAEVAIAKEYCREGNGSACEALCLQSPEKSYCEQSCSKFNSREACYALASQDGYDKESIEHLYKYGCIRNDLSACMSLARLKYEEKDNATYSRLLRLTCDLGDVPSCEATGTYHAMYVSEESARPFFEKTCSFGSANGCLLNCQNEIRMGNLAKARKVLENLCKYHSLETCPKPFNKKLNDEELTLACRL